MTEVHDSPPADTVAAPAVAYQLIDSDEALALACEHWSSQSWLAVDTEFIRTSTFYPQVGLVQVSDGQEVWLIDPLPIENWSAFTCLMTSQETIKVLHSCSEDLLVFIAFLGVMPTPVFDTQIAASFLGEGLSLSYQNLVQVMCGIDLPKGETRSDWLRRPLSQEQLDYAALDVLYLPDIAQRQAAELESKGRLAWVEEECERMRELYECELSGDFTDYYRQLRLAWQLQKRSLLALKLLAEWREKRARARDKPRNWIVKDVELQSIAAAMPSTMQALADCSDLHPGFLRHEGESVLKLVKQARETAEEDLPAPLPRPLTQGQKKRYKRVKALVESCAEQLAVPVELLGRKKLLVDYIQSTEGNQAGPVSGSADASLPRALREGWRGSILLALLEQERQDNGTIIKSDKGSDNGSGNGNDNGG